MEFETEEDTDALSKRDDVIPRQAFVCVVKTTPVLADGNIWR